MTEQLKAKVLLVDDEEEFLKTLAERLSLRGLKVTTATSGKEALSSIEGKAFDLIVLDLAMPGMDGIESLKRIKEKQPDAEIIMLSGQGSIRTSIEAMKLGACDFLQKPVDINNLLEKVSAAKDKRMLMLETKNISEIEKILKTKGW